MGLKELLEKRARLWEQAKGINELEIIAAVSTAGKCGTLAANTKASSGDAIKSSARKNSAPLRT